MSNSDPSHDFGTTGAARAVRVNGAYAAVAAAARLADLPSTALTLALGVIAGSANPTAAPGRVAALCDELSRRGEWQALLGVLDRELAARIMALYTADRGRMWAATGRR